MSEAAYVDTSAFIKRFLNEDRTSDMEAFAMDSKYRMAISSLTVTEFRSVLRRRLRMGTVGLEFVGKATQQLLKEIAAGALRFHAIDGATFNLAGDLIEQVESPLATLDALHLACAKACGAVIMVSADKQLLRASREAGLEILDFSPVAA
jgi:predicted nucleic acid-binding protein